MPIYRFNGLLKGELYGFYMVRMLYCSVRSCCMGLVPPPEVDNTHFPIIDSFILPGAISHFAVRMDSGKLHACLVFCWTICTNFSVFS